MFVVYLASYYLDIFYSCMPSPSVPIPRGISKFDGENTATLVDAAIDSFDQNEETVDCKHTTHSMVIVLYQQSLATPESDLIPCSNAKVVGHCCVQ